MKKIFILTVIIGFFFAGCDKDKTEYKIPTADVLSKGNNADAVFAQKKLSRSVNNCNPGAEGCTYIRLNYIEAAPGGIFDKINAMIKKELMNAYEMPDKNLDNPQLMMESFIKDYEAFTAKNPKTALTWTLDYSCRVYAENNKIYCIIFENAGYMGGTHPVITTKYKNVFKDSGEEASLEALLGPGFENRLNTVIEKNYRTWRKLEPGDDLKLKGELFENSIKFTNNFAVTNEKGLEFFYQTGEIMPASYGPIVIKLSQKEVSDLIPVSSPLK